MENNNYQNDEDSRSTEEKLVEDRTVQIDKLQSAANDYSVHVRNVYLTFMIFGAYVAIIFGSTTHEQLILEAPITLPLLNVGLPIVGLYWIAPALLVLMHFNLLIQLYMLSDVLYQLAQSIKGIADTRKRYEQSTLLYPFPFSHMIGGIHHHTSLAQKIFTIIVWITVVVVPVAIPNLRPDPFFTVP